MSAHHMSRADMDVRHAYGVCLYLIHEITRSRRIRHGIHASDLMKMHFADRRIMCDSFSLSYNPINPHHIFFDFI